MTASRLLRAERSEIEEFFKNLKLKFASSYVDVGIDCPEIYTGYGTRWKESSCRKLLKKSGMIMVLLALHLPDNYDLYPNSKVEFIVCPSVILVKGPRRSLTITFDKDGRFEKLLDSLEIT